MNSNHTLKKVAIKIYRLILKPIAKKYNTFTSQNIPKYEIKEKHIKNAKLLTTREELLRILPKNGVVAELGVNKGDFSNLILTINNPKKLHLIDYWGSKRYNLDIRKRVENRFETEIKNNTVEINLGLSTEIADNFKDNYFDWIYIDTTHFYETTIQELKLYSKKVKENGIIAGHDYILGNWNGIVRYGVIEAVHEFCFNYNWEILYITTELNNHPSFAIRRIPENKNL